MPRALIVHGGWDGHQPKETAELLAEELGNASIDVELSDTLDRFAAGDLMDFDLLVPHWTMGEIAKEQVNPLLDAVKAGVGLAGVHGGMGDAFRKSTDFQFATGGQFVAHPGNDGTPYPVHIVDRAHAITQGVDDFTVSSEQYYMHVDPANHVLATTPFPTPGVDGPHLRNGPVVMPVAWTRYFGEGRVFYCSLGHQRDILDMPPVRRLVRQGFCWSIRNAKFSQ